MTGLSNVFSACAAFCAALAFAAIQPQAFAEGVEGPALKNGVSLHGPLTWGRCDASRTGYLDPVYDDPKYVVPTELLRKTKAAGFDFIRLSVDPGPLLALEGERLKALDNHVMSVVAEIRAAGLDVLLDFHPISMVKPYGRTAIMADKPDSLFPKYVDTVRRYAFLLGETDLRHVAIEPMNEPAIGNEPEAIKRWQRMMDALYGAARAGSKDIVIVATGTSGGGIDGLCFLDPSGYDVRTRYSFHYYLPYPLTHAGVGSVSSIGACFSELPYPAEASGFEPFWAKVEERLKTAKGVKPEDIPPGRKRLEAYFQKQGGKEFIAANFAKVGQWASKYGIEPGRIFMGEFGVAQLKGPNKTGILPDDRARWLRDAREEADRLGFHWAMWVLCGESAWGMTLVDPAAPERLDILTLKALGKAAPQD